MNRYDDDPEAEWDEDAWDEDDSVEWIDCPSCGAEIYEEAQQCPHCGDYIVPNNSVWLGRPWWWIVIGVVGIAATILALSLG